MAFGFDGYGARKFGGVGFMRTTVVLLVAGLIVLLGGTSFCRRYETRP